MRGTGRTTAQIKAAKPGAVFIWCNCNLSYLRSLVKKLGRDDLKLYQLSVLDGFAEQLRGHEFSEIILDHAAEPTSRQFDNYAHLRDYAMARSSVS